MKEIRTSGTWNIAGQRGIYQGELDINRMEGAIRLTVTVPEGQLEGVVEGRRISMIQGDLMSGWSVTLVDSEIRRIQEQRFDEVRLDIFSKIAVLGDHFDTLGELQFKNYRFRLSNAVDWADLCKFTQEVEKESKERVPFVWQRRESIRIEANSDLEIAITPVLDESQMDYFARDISLKQDVDIDFYYKEDTSLEKCIEDVKAIKYLISLAIKQDIWIERMYYLDSDDEGEGRPISRGEVILARRQGLEESINRYDPFFFLTSLKKENFYQWFDKFEKLKPIMDLYLATVKNVEMPIEIQFLSIVQALEVYHSRFVTNERVEYRDRIRALFDTLSDQIRPIFEAAFMDKEIKRANRILLKSRLNDLMYLQRGKMEFYNFCDEKYPFDFVDMVVNTRHYLTHYGDERKDSAVHGVKLRITCDILLLVLAFHLLKELGMAEDVYVLDKLNERQEAIWRQYREVVGE